MVHGRPGSSSCNCFHVKLRGTRRTAKPDRSKPVLSRGLFLPCSDECNLPRAAVFLGGYRRSAAVTAEVFAASRRSWRRSLPLRGGSGHGGGLFYTDTKATQKLLHMRLPPFFITGTCLGFAPLRGTCEEGWRKWWPPGVVVAPSSSVIVAWCVEWVVVETLNMLGYQRGQVARYAALQVAARRANAVEGTGEFGCPSVWVCELTFDELIDAGCPIPGCDGFWGGHGCAAAPVASACTPATASESASAARWRSGVFRRTAMCVCVLVHCQ